MQRHFLSMTLNQNEQKALLANRATDFVEAGMLLGLGTGSTVDIFITMLGEKFGSLQSLEIIPTSLTSAAKAAKLGVKILDPASCLVPDLLIDGADEVAADLSMIKGGGGALLWEKIVAKSARRRVYLADSTKLVRELGEFLLPIEVIQFGHEWSCLELEKVFKKVSLRTTVSGDIFKTDSGNIIYDCKISKKVEKLKLDRDLLHVPGIVTSGLFFDFIDTLLTVRDDNVVVIERTKDVFW
jgi:ribose 5-phosphate isomerase A